MATSKKCSSRCSLTTITLYSISPSPSPLKIIYVQACTHFQQYAQTFKNMCTLKNMHTLFLYLSLSPSLTTIPLYSISSSPSLLNIIDIWACTHFQQYAQTFKNMYTLKNMHTLLKTHTHFWKNVHTFEKICAFLKAHVLLKTHMCC